MDYRVLGRLEVLVDGTALSLGGPKQRVVVAMLIAAAGRPVSLDVLLEAVYGEDGAAGGRRSLQTYVSNLRQVLGEVIVRQGDAYLLRCDGTEIDAVVFEDTYRAALAVTAGERAGAQLRAALAMWRGHPYVDVEAHGALDAEVVRLSELRVTATEARIEADLNAGRHREVIAELEALTVEYPWREGLRALHMLALYRAGRQTEALRAFGRTRVALRDGLGVSPSPELRELERRILDQDGGLLISVGSVVQRRAVLVADVDDSVGWLDPWRREAAFARRDAELAAAVEGAGGVRLSPKGSAGYAVFSEPIDAVRAARALVDGDTRVAVDYGDVEVHGDEDPVGPPLGRATRLVAVAHRGQVLLSSDVHDALAAGGLAGWAAESLGRFDIVGLDSGVLVYQLVGEGLTAARRDLLVDRLPPLLPATTGSSVPGYELRALVGSGELGEVHRAYQAAVGREVAVRVFGPSTVRHPQFVRRFEAASQRIARVEHPHVLPLLDYWREPTRAVMVTRLLTGGHLRERIPAGGMDRSVALAVFETVAAGVSAAHQLGVVHGRVRPENVLFDGAGNAYVADLGIDEICTGIISFATNAYDAPERLGGSLATPASDVFSLGLLAHEMVCGSPPPQDGPPSLGASPLGRLVTRATDPDPRRRLGSVDQLVDELREALGAPRRPAVFVPTRNPYRGLEPFEEADAGDFYGRDLTVAAMVDVLGREPLLVVFGRSGIGKTSVVKAGLVPALRRGAVHGSESWLITEMTPGDAPLERLHAALARVATVPLPDIVDELGHRAVSLVDVVRRVVPSDTNVVIVVDQFEELFTQTVNEDERRTFMRLIVDIATRPDVVVRFVVTVRADFFDQPLGYPGFAEALRGRAIALGAMSAEELADAVRRPAADVGVDVEPALVEQITAEAEQAPGALPLVQHTMSELFDQRAANVITRAAYDESGGMAGAIGRRAETLYLGFDDHTRDAAREVFLRLVNVAEDRADTRRRVRRPELEAAGVAPDELGVVLTDYGRHRLLTFDRDPATRTPTVEVAHEALLREWKRFAEWIDAARDDLLGRRRIESATHDWLAAGSDPSFLFTGGRLEVAETWAATSRFQLSEDEHRFLADGRQRVDDERSARARRRRRITRTLVGAVVVLAAVAAFALVQRSAAQRQTRETRARELAGQAQLAIGEDPERAIMLALAAADRTDAPLPEAVSALQAATQSTRLVNAVDNLFGGGVAFAPNGSMVAVDRDDSNVMLIEPESGDVLAEVSTSHQIGDDGLAFDAHGAELDVGYVGVTADGPAIGRFAVPSGRLMGTLPGPAGSYEQLANSPDGRWLGAVRRQGYEAEAAVIEIWAIDDPSAPTVPISLGTGVSFGFLPGTTSVIVARVDDSTLRVVDIPSARVVREIEAPAGTIRGMGVDPTGRLVALWFVSALQLIVLDLDSGDQAAALEMNVPSSVEFSPDGRWLAVGGNDHLLRLFDTETFTETRLAGSPDDVFPLAFSPDSSRLVSKAVGQLRLWDVTPEGPPALGNFATASRSTWVGGIVVARDESTASVIAVEGDDSATVERIDRASGEHVEVANGIQYEPNNLIPLLSANQAVAAGLDDELRTRIVDLDTGTHTLLDPCEAVRALDQSGRLALVDGAYLCTGVADFATLPFPPAPSRVVDLRTRETVLQLGVAPFWSGAFGPPGDDGLPALIAVLGAPDSYVSVHTLPTGRRIGAYLAEGFALNAVFSPDGKRLAFGTSSGQLIVIDIARLADPSADPVVWKVAAHNSSVWGIAFSHSGLLATAATAGNVRIWSTDGALLADIPIRPGSPPDIAFASGTDTLYYEDGGGVIRRFTTDTAELDQLARSMLTRELTPEECTRYFADERCPVFTG